VKENGVKNVGSILAYVYYFLYVYFLK